MNLREQMDAREENRKRARKTAEDRIAEMRPVYESSLFRFAKEILGYKDLDRSLHGPICTALKKNEDNLFLLPRGHLKSSLVTIAYPIWCIIKNPNIRIHITNAVLSVSIKFLREIKEHMEKNALLKTMWPKVFYTIPDKQAPKWTENEIVVRRTKNLKDATISVGSVGKTETGAHYDRIVYDDIVNEDNVNTPDQIEKTFNWYRMSRALLDPGARTAIVGTRYDFSEMYQRLIESTMPRIIRKAVEGPEIEDVVGTDREDELNDHVILPRLFTWDRDELVPDSDPPRNKAKIKKKREEQGSYIFSCQYMNLPIDQDTAKFKRKYLRFWHEQDLPAKMNNYLLVDLAVSQKETACETAMEVVGFSEKGEIYCLEDCSGIFTPMQTIDHMYRLYGKWNHPLIGIERMQAEKVMEYWLLEEGKRRGQMLVYHKLIPDMDKIRRIGNLVPFWEQEKLFLKPGMQELENQFLRFPRYNKRDRIDALAYIVQMATRPNMRARIQVIKGSYGSIWEKVGNQLRVVDKRQGKNVSLMTF